MIDIFPSKSFSVSHSHIFKGEIFQKAFRLFNFYLFGQRPNFDILKICFLPFFSHAFFLFAPDYNRINDIFLTILF